MSFEAQPGLAQPGMFSPGLLEAGTIEASNADVLSATDGQSLAVTLSDADTGSALDAQSVSVTTTAEDTGSATESESITVQVSDADTGSATDAEITSASITDGDPSTGSEAESVASTLSDSDTATATETEDVNVPGGTTPSDADTGSASDGQSIVATLSAEGDTGSASEDQSITVTLSSADTGSGTDGETVQDGGTAPESADTFSATETESIAVTLSSADTASAGETQVSPGQSLPTIGNYQATLVMGPATVYVADYGTAIPDDTEPLGGSWVDLGGTLGGVVLTCIQEMEQKRVNQAVENPASRLKNRDLTVETILAEPVLANLLYALNQGSITTGSGYKSYEPPVVDRATPLTYRTVVIDGWSPGIDPATNRHLRRRIVLRKALSTDGTTVNYSRDKQSGQDVTWSVHYVDSTTAPFKVIDEQ